MKKVISLILALIMITAVLSGCQKPEPEPEPSPSVSVEPTPEPTPEPTEEPADVSETSGREKADDYVYNPIMVMIENLAPARPQTALNQADIVYEALAESNITRFACIFNDQYPVVAGPVRSTRLYYINMLREWDASLVHVGGPSDKSKPSYVYGPDTEDIKVRIDGMKGVNGSYFWRSSDRKIPHNCYTNVQKIKDEKVDYTPDEKDTPWIFVTNEEKQKELYADGETFEEISLPFISSDGFVSYKYNAEENKLYRFMDGKEFMTYTITVDEDGKQNTEEEQVCVQNLIVQYANTYQLKGDVKGRRGYDTIGEGAAEFFINGRHFSGTWKRESKDTDTVFLTEDGEQLQLLPGNTWIEVHPTSAQITVK